MCLCAGSQIIIWAHFYFQEKVLQREALEWNNQMGLPCPMVLLLPLLFSFFLPQTSASCSMCFFCYPFL